MPLSVFLAQKKLSRGNDIIALGIAVWANRYRKEDTVTVDTMKAHWKTSKKKVPSNVSRDMGKAATEGWLERHASGGTYSVTSYGEAHWDDLPASEG